MNRSMRRPSPPQGSHGTRYSSDRRVTYYCSSRSVWRMLSMKVLLLGMERGQRPLANARRACASSEQQQDYPSYAPPRDDASYHFMPSSVTAFVHAGWMVHWQLRRHKIYLPNIQQCVTGEILWRPPCSSCSASQTPSSCMALPISSASTAPAGCAPESRFLVIHGLLFLLNVR